MSWLQSIYDWFFPNMVVVDKEKPDKIENFGIIDQQPVFTRQTFGYPINFEPRMSYKDVLMMSSKSRES